MDKTEVVMIQEICKSDSYLFAPPEKDDGDELDFDYELYRELTHFLGRFDT